MIALAALDITDPTSVLAPSDGETRVLIRAGRTVLGEASLGAIPASEVDLQTARLRRRWASYIPDPQWRPLRSADVFEASDVTVVVCTRDRPQLLRGCLQHLLEADPAPGQVLVVDNAPSDDDTARLCHELCIARVVEPTIGLNRARNRGWQAASTPIVAYVDDDARVDRWFAAAVARGFSTPGVGAVTGLVLPAELMTEAQEVFERVCGGMRKGYRARVFHRDTTEIGFASFELGVGTNMAFRAAVLAKLGGFDHRLGVGTPTRGGGDLDMLGRVYDAGHTVVYDPSVLVRHIHRRTIRGLLGQMRDNGVAFSALLAKREAEHPPASAVRAYRRGWWWQRHLRRVVSSVLRRDWWTLLLATAELVGSVHGAGAFREQARRIPAPQPAPEAPAVVDLTAHEDGGESTVSDAGPSIVSTAASHQ